MVFPEIKPLIEMPSSDLLPIICSNAIRINHLLLAEEKRLVSIQFQTGKEG